MADNFLDSLAGTSTLDEIRRNSYEKYKDKFKDSTEDLINSDTFLSLMVAEMTNQDPLEPTSNTEFITQLAGFSQLSYARDSSTYSMANYATSLVGKVVTATKPDGKNQITKTGVVESVSKMGNSYKIIVDGETFDISKVTKVEPGSGEGAGVGSISSNALADSIVRASGMIGMYATAKTDDGVAVGWIDTIKVNDGKLSAVLANEDGTVIGEYNIDKLSEITVASFGFDMPDGTENSTNEPEKSEDNTEKVNGVEGTGT